MPKTIKIVLMTAGGLVGLLILAAGALLLLVDANAYKPRLEAAASKALGMEVKVGGPMGIRFAPGLVVTLRDVHGARRGEEVASAAAARLGIALLPLLHKQVRVTSVALQQPTIAVARDRDGRLDLAPPKWAESLPTGLELAKLSMAGGTVRYTDQQSGSMFEARDCDLALHHLRLGGGAEGDLLRALSFTAELACGEFGTKDFTTTDLKLSATAAQGVVELRPVAMRVFGAPGTGRIHADFSGELPHYSVDCQLPGFQVSEFFKTLGPKPVATGTMDFTAQLSLQGTTGKELRQTLAGKISLSGKDITLKNRDLDAELDRFESSQSFNLVDVGAFFIAGPVGLLVTKGYNFASLLQGPGGSSEIRTLVSEWQVAHGVAQAQDVALATKEHRLALRGGLDFARERFADMTVALIDARGCAAVEQKISGSFQKPVVEKPNFFATLTGPALNLLKKGLALFPGGKCEVIYSGSVAPPP